MTATIDAKEYVTAAEAAHELETTLPRVLMLLRGNVLEGARLDGEWYVAMDSVARGKTHGPEMKPVKRCTSHCSSGGCACT